MLIIILSRSSSKLGHVGSKTRSLGKILEKPCVHSKRHSFFFKVHETLSECLSSYCLGQVQDWVMLGQKLGR